MKLESKKLLKKVKKISAKRAIWTSFAVDFLDVFVNLIVAIITGSMVMVAETLQGIADLTSDIFVLIGLKTSTKKATKTHPLGYGRSLYVWAFMATIIMFLITATLTFYFGLQRFLNPAPVKNIFLAYSVLFIFVFTNGYAFSISSKRILEGDKIKKLVNNFRKSDWIETKIIVISDFVGTLAAIIGIIALILYEITGNMRFDGLGAMSIGIAIMFFAVILIKESKSLLIGKNASEAIERKIRSMISETNNVKELLSLNTLNIGLGKILVNMELHLKDGLITDEIERIIEVIEKKIKDEIPEVKQIHIELRAKKSKMK